MIGNDGSSVEEASRVVTSLPAPASEVDWVSLPPMNRQMLAAIYLLGVPVSLDQVMAALRDPAFHPRLVAFLREHAGANDGD